MTELRYQMMTFFLFKDIGVLLKDRWVRVVGTVKHILDGKVHFYQKVILEILVKENPQKNDFE